MWPAMRRVYHPYHVWEDYRAGMYNLSDRIEEHRALSRELLADPVELLKGMRDAIEAWPLAAEHNLTGLGLNRRAWLGAVACCYVHGAREHTVRDAWWSLTEAQKAAANGVADRVIEEWEEAQYAPSLFPFGGRKEEECPNVDWGWMS